MRTLRFIVKDQIIEKDPNCDFSNLVPGTDGYLRAEFSFSPEWDGYAKAAVFWSMMGKLYPSRKLDSSGGCEIPAEALKKMAFKIGVVGKKGDVKLNTNKLVMRQDGGKK